MHITGPQSIPLISVVIPFRNAEATLPECLDSLQGQTEQNFEALLIDDGTEDRSAQIVSERARMDRRLHLLSPGNVGLVQALNIGIGQSQADFIARMDADDIMYPDRLSRQKEFLHAHPHIDLVGCQVKLFPDEAVQEGYKEYVRWQNGCVLPEDIASNMYVESTLAHPSVMIRRGAFDRAGGYREGPFPEDYDLWLRMHEAGHLMAKVPEVLLLWRERPDRTSRVDPRCSEEAFDQLRARYLARDPRLQASSKIVVWGGGRSTRSRVKLLLEQGVRIHAWVDVDPGRIGMTIWGLPVYPYTWLDKPDRPLVLVYVANHGARDQIAGVLEKWGYRRGNDYLTVG